VKHPTKNSNLRQRERGFTLIELLAVVAIIGLAFGIAVAALPGMTRGSAMRGSTAELRATISLARQWAVGHREVTYVVFADGQIDYSGSAEKTLAGERAYRGYAVVGEHSGFVSDWKFLKPGVYFLPAENLERDDSNSARSPAHSLNTKNPFYRNVPGFTEVEVPFPEPEDPKILFPGIGFKPDGGLKSGAMPKEVYISEGFVTAAVGREDIDLNDLQFKPDATVTGFHVAGLTGAVRVRVYGEF